MAVPAAVKSADSKFGDGLATLSALLATHRAHLLDLFTSLGHPNPCSHVSSKISELHESLIETVKRQANEAEDEVESLRRDAEEIEGRIRSTRISLGQPEVEVEDGLSECQGENLIKRLARLKQLEIGLVEVVEVREAQVGDLKCRIKGFAPVLGDTAVNKALKEDSTRLSSGFEAPSNLSLSYIQRLEKHITAFGADVLRRKDKVNEDLQEICNIWGDLGLSPDHTNASTTRSSTFVSLNTEPPDDDFDQLILQHLRAQMATQDDPGVDSQSLLATDEILHRASTRRQWLTTEKELRESEIQQLYDGIAPLWTGLGVADEDQEMFIEAWMGLSDACIAGYRAELERMKEERAKHMETFVGTERATIEALWNQMYIGEEERQELDIMTSNVFTEELLEAHQKLHQSLDEEVITRAPVLAVLDSYFTLIQEAHELEMSEKDPDRYAKGRRGDPGRLLREEKIRKRIAREKPKLENELQKTIPKWEIFQGRPFLVNGSRFLDDLNAKLGQDASSKENNKRTRSGTVSATPSVKRQHTGTTASKPWSPNKRSRTVSVSKSRGPPPPPSTAMRGSAVPFGTQSLNTNDQVATRRIQAPGSVMKRATKTSSSQSTLKHSTTSTRSLTTQMTGNSLLVDNTMTPTPISSSSSCLLSLPTTTTTSSLSMSLSSTTKSTAKQNRVVSAPIWVGRRGVDEEESRRSSSSHVFDQPVVATTSRSMSFRPRLSVSQSTH